MTLASQLSAKEIVMVCDAHTDKTRYYKLIKSFFKNTVEQKVDGRWLSWIDREREEINVVKSEIYDTGAMLVISFLEEWKYDDPEEEIVGGQEYYVEGSYLLDFEFGLRKVKYRIYEDETKAKELKKHYWRRKYSKDYTCEFRN